MLHATSLSKEYSGSIGQASHRAVDQVTFSVAAGELFGFLGANGAGKTTTIKMLAGLLSPTRGTVTIDQYDMGKDPLAAKRLVGYVPDRPLLYDRLTGREFVQFMAELYSLPKQVLADAERYYTEFDLRDVVDERISGYSHGMKQKIALIGQLVHKPRVLLLDEPTVGLDPQGARTLRTTLRTLCGEGVAVLISTHLLPVAEMLCDRVGIMHRGCLIASGTVPELQSLYETDADLEELFLRLTTSEAADTRS